MCVCVCRTCAAKASINRSIFCASPGQRRYLSYLSIYLDNIHINVYMCVCVAPVLRMLSSATILYPSTPPFGSDRPEAACRRYHSISNLGKPNPIL